SSQAAALTPTYATTSCQRCVSSCLRMPPSIASPTRCQPTTGAAAETAASSMTTRIRRWRPSVYCQRRDSPVRRLRVLRSNCLVSEQPCEGPAAAEQVRRATVLDDDAVLEDDRAVGHEDRRQTLARDEDGAARHGRAQGLDPQA